MAGYRDYGFANDRSPHTFGYLMKPLLSQLSKDKNQAILDLGCGNGFLVDFLLKQGFNAYGTDASEEGIAIARRAHPDRFFLQDLSTDRLPEELQNVTFDTILSTEVIEHLYDPEAFIAFCKDHLPPGGELILSTPYHGYLKNLVLSLFDRWDDHLSPDWHGGHIKFWSRRTLGRLLEKGGFTVTRFTGCGRMPLVWKSMILKARSN